MNNKTWYCKRHLNYFTNLCIGCADDIFHHGFGLESVIEVTQPNYEWDDTYWFINSL